MITGKVGQDVLEIQHAVNSTATAAAADHRLALPARFSFIRSILVKTKLVNTATALIRITSQVVILVLHVGLPSDILQLRSNTR